MIDTQALITELLPALNADSRSQLLSWTQDHLEQWIDDGLKRLARYAAVWVERDTSNTTANGTAEYSLPARHIATLHASYGTRPLRPASSIELEMRNPSYRTAAATADLPPAYWYEDLEGGSLIGVTPVPIARVSLPLVCTMWPPAIDTAEVNTTVEAPQPLAGYLAMCVLAKAYGRESEMEMPDAAQHCEARLELYEHVFQHLYGPGL